MTAWKPSPTIAVKVLGLAWRAGSLLVTEVKDGVGRVKGLRPLGGSIEFGESREEAIHREFQEELGCSIELMGPWHSLENIFEHEGAIGHEVLFSANIKLGEPSLYVKERIDFLEANGVSCSALWISPSSLPKGVELYPTALLSLIEAGTVSPPDPKRRCD